MKETKHSCIISNVSLTAETQEQHIYIHEGKIEHISTQAPGSIEKKHIPLIDAHGYIAMPGMIDAHTHMREPGLTYKENFRSGSMAAAMGGVTTFFDMPNTIPSTVTYSHLKEKRILARSSIIDYALHFGATNTTGATEIQHCITQCKKINMIPASIKVFLNETTGNLCIESLDVLEEIVQHAWCISAHAEEEKIETIISLTQKYNVPLYLVHISRKSEIEYIKSIKKQNTTSPIYVEVCPHHLAFTKDDLYHNPLLSMKPPLQSKHDQYALWDAIHDNIVDSIGSDHAPHTLLEKQHALKNKQQLYGVPGVDTTLLYLLDACKKKNITLNTIRTLCSANPATIFGLLQKGTLTVGSDADIVLVSLNETTQYKNDMLSSNYSWSIFDGTLFESSIGATMSNGAMVFLSQPLLKKYYNKNNHIVLQSNTLGNILLHTGKELTCHA